MNKKRKVIFRWTLLGFLGFDIKCRVFEINVNLKAKHGPTKDRKQKAKRKGCVCKRRADDDDGSKEVLYM